MSDEIIYEVDDPVATITLNRPASLNALTYSMLRAFREAVDDAARDPRVVGIVITGAKEGAAPLVGKRPPNLPRLGNG